MTEESQSRSRDKIEIKVNTYNKSQTNTVIDYHQQALSITRDIGDRQWSGGCLGNLGTAYFSLGQYYTALDYHQQALDLAREIGERQGEGIALGNLGAAYQPSQGYVNKC